MTRMASQRVVEIKRLLVVEDEPGIQRAVRLVLEDWEVLPATTLAEARGIVATDARFDVALIDKNLRDGSGLELARELREQRPHVAVILMTAYPTMESAIEAVATGVFDYLPKPFDAGVLALKVGNAGERVRLEREQVRMADRLRRAEALELVGQLAGGFAHDFNNLLVVLYAAVDQLRPAIAQVPGEDGRSAAEWLDEIRTTSDRASDLARRMLGMSKRPASTVEIVNLGEVIAEARVLLHRTLEANINVEIITGTRVPAVKLGRAAVEQILLNLAINARDAMPRGGTLTIETSRVDGDGPGRAQLAVSDTGTGIPPEVVARIFEPFFTTKGPTRGTGLGLATVQRLVEDAGGTIGVESRIGAGTTFTVELPGSAVQAPARPRTRTRDELKGRGETILLLEDDPAVRTSIDRMLTTSGYAVTAVGTAREARAELAARPFEVVICDVMVPDASGYDVVAELLASDPRRRAICISGYGAAGTGAQNTPFESVPFLAKPFTADQIMSLVREVLAR